MDITGTEASHVSRIQLASSQYLDMLSPAYVCRGLIGLRTWSDASAKKELSEVTLLGDHLQFVPSDARADIYSYDKHQLPVGAFSKLLGQGSQVHSSAASDPPPVALERSIIAERGWVACSKCDKWRSLPPSVDVEQLPDVWHCEMNEFDPSHNSCDHEEEQAMIGEEESALFPLPTATDTTATTATTAAIAASTGAGTAKEKVGQELDPELAPKLKFSLTSLKALAAHKKSEKSYKPLVASAGAGGGDDEDLFGSDNEEHVSEHEADGDFQPGTASGAGNSNFRSEEVEVKVKVKRVKLMMKPKKKRVARSKVAEEDIYKKSYDALEDVEVGSGDDEEGGATLYGTRRKKIGKKFLDEVENVEVDGSGGDAAFDTDLGKDEEYEAPVEEFSAVASTTTTGRGQYGNSSSSSSPAAAGGNSTDNNNKAKNNNKLWAATKVSQADFVFSSDEDEGDEEVDEDDYDLGVEPGR